MENDADFYHIEKTLNFSKKLKSCILEILVKNSQIKDFSHMANIKCRCLKGPTGDFNL